MNAYKRYVLFVFVIPLPLIALLAINLYLYDPAQIFHKPYFRETTFFPDMRVAARGIIQHYPFDSYILGTSMLENTSAKEAKEKLGGEWVNISMSGSTFEERALVMQYLFGIKQPKQILYSLDYLANINENNKMSIKLYNDSKLDDFGFYLNNRFVLCSLIWSKNKHCIGDSKAKIEDSLVSWIDSQSHVGRFGGFENWSKFGDNMNIQDGKKVFQALLDREFSVSQPYDEGLNLKIRDSIRKNILSFVEQNKSTQFYFILPTYSRLNYRMKRDSRGIDNFVQFQQSLLWLIKEIEKLPNAALYGFDTTNYADEIANYKDLTHYNIDMNSMQLDAILDNTHRLTSGNIEEYLKAMELKIQEYDVEPLVKIAKEALGGK